jgi:hypothetical protein
MLSCYYSNTYSLARGGGPGSPSRGGTIWTPKLDIYFCPSKTQECPNRRLRAVNFFFVIRNTKKPGCD